VKDVAQSFVNFSNVVKQGDSFDAPACSIVEPGCVAKNQSVRRNTPHVSACVAVICIDRIEESLQRCRAKSLSANSRSPLANEKSTRRNSERIGSELEHTRHPGQEAYMRIRWVTLAK